MWQRIIAIYLSFSLMVNPVIASGLDEQATAQTSPVSASKDNQSQGFQVVYQSDKSGNRELVVIIDAHSNLCAQYSINTILDQYSTRDNLYAVYLEGASGILNPDQFAVFDDDRITNCTAQVLLENRFITGAEYFGMTTSKNVTFKGAESKDIYEENLERFIELKSMTEKIQIEQLIDIFNELIRSKEQERFVKLDELYTTVLTTGQNLIPFVDTFFDYYCFDFDEIGTQFPLLSDFVYSIKKSSYVQNLIQKSLIRLANYLMTDSQYEEDLNEVKYLLLYTNTQNYFERAYSLFEKHPKPLIPAMIKQIKKYRDSRAALDSASSNDIYLEIIKAYRAFYCELEGTKLFDARDALFAILKGGRLNLTPEEVDYFNVGQFDESVYIPFLSKVKSMTPNKLKEWVTEIEKMHALSTMIDSFYRSVEKRNDSIYSTISSDLPYDKSAVLIVGGYHREIFNTFEENGFQLTVIRPELDFTSEANADIDYLDQLYGRLSSIEKMIYYSWSPIVHRLISQPVSGFNSRKAASKLFTAEYTALLTGAAIQVHLNESEGLDKYHTISRIKETFTQFFNSEEHNKLIASYLNLPGTEFAPRESEILDYQKIADGKGFTAVFRIGSETMAVQWLPAGSNLTPVEQEILSSLPGYQPKSSINLQDESFDISFVHIPSQPSVLNKMKGFVTKTLLAVMLIIAVCISSGFLTDAGDLHAQELSHEISFSQNEINTFQQYTNQLQTGLKAEKQRIIQSLTGDPAIQAQIDQMQGLDVPKLATDTDIMIFSDSHSVIQIANLMKRSLSDLKKQGYTQVALELNSDFQPIFDRWNQDDRTMTLRSFKLGMDKKSGLGVAENLLDLIDEAKRLGMRVVAYDVPDRNMYGGTTSLAVETQWYKTLNESLEKFGGKMVMLAGEFHMKKDRRDVNPFFYDGRHRVSVLYFTGGEMAPFNEKGYDIGSENITNIFTVMEASDVESRVMVPMPEDVSALYTQHEQARNMQDASYKPQKPINKGSLVRNNWMVVLPDATYAPLPPEELPAGPGFYVDADASRQSIKEIMNLKYSFINPHVEKLREMGLIDDDVATIANMDDMQLISGEFGINPMNEVIGNDLHSYILDSYQREITNRVVNTIGTFEVTIQFKQAVIHWAVEHGQSMEQAEQLFQDMRSLLAKQLRIKSDPTSDKYHFASDIDFAVEMVDFYFTNRLTSEGKSFFSNPVFVDADGNEFLGDIMRNALGQNYFDMLNFAPSASFASDAYRSQQRDFIKKLYNEAIQQDIPAPDLSIFMLQRPNGGEALKMQLTKKAQTIGNSHAIDSSL